MSTTDQVYDNSQLQAFKDCREEYRLKYRYVKDPETGLWKGLKKREEGVEEHHKGFGTALHAGLKVYYEGLKAKQPMRMSIGDALAAFEKEFPVQLDPNDKVKTLAAGKHLLTAYQQRYGGEDENLEILSTEVRDKIEIAPGIFYTVKIDLVFRQQGCIYFMDHKSTSKAFAWNYWAQFDPNSQITGYSAYIRKKFGECSGGWINGLQLGHRDEKKPEYSEGPFDVFYANTTHDFSKYHKQVMYKGWGPYAKFERQLFNRDAAQEARWLDQTLKWIKEMQAEEKKGQTPWLVNEGFCTYCSFKDICVSCTDEQIIEQLYEVVDPHKYLDAGEKELTA